MVDLRPYGKLQSIQLLKGLIRKWWGVELAFADGRRYVLDHADGKIIPPGNDMCRLALFSKEGFRRCNESVRQVRDRLKNAGGNGAVSGSLRTRKAYVHECHLGFDVVAAPIVLDGELAGFLFVGGSVHQPLTSRSDLIRRVREFAAPADVAAADPERTRIPEIAGESLEHLMDLLEVGVAEIAAYHASEKARESELTQVSRELGERYRF